MKFHLLILVASLGVLTLCSNCKSDSPSSAKTTEVVANTAATADQTAAPSVAPTDVPAATVPTNVPAPNVTTPNDVKKPEPAQNAKGVWHYTCAKGCAGGAGAAQACAKCSATLVHNGAYHENAAPATQSNPNNKPADAPKPEPAQNAKGVWHYTCADGCAGGAGSATPCAKCGKALAHNSAYHQ